MEGPITFVAIDGIEGGLSISDDFLDLFFEDTAEKIENIPYKIIKDNISPFTKINTITEKLIPRIKFFLKKFLFFMFFIFHR